MEDLVMKFNSKYDLEAIKSYNKYNLYSGIVYKIITALAVLLIIFAIVVDLSLPLKISSFVIAVAWILEIIFLPNLRAKSIMKSSRISKDAIVEMEFKDANIFMITKKKDDIIGTSVIEYNDIYKICNTKDYIYVYIAKNQAIICSKKNMKGNYKKFLALLKKKLGKRYKGE